MSSGYRPTVARITGMTIMIQGSPVGTVAAVAAAGVRMRES